MDVGDRRMSCAHLAVLTLLALVAAGCSPTLDWREVRADGGSLSSLFPCRPRSDERSVELVGKARPMTMRSCAAGASTYALAFVDLDDPAAVAPALNALRQAAVSNLHAADPASAAFAVRGATASSASGRVLIRGRLPDGKEVQEHAAFFVRGLRVYQASIIGRAPEQEEVDPFFSGLRFAP
jgi:hypothetical protein